VALSTIKTVLVIVSVVILPTVLRPAAANVKVTPGMFPANGASVTTVYNTAVVPLEISTFEAVPLAATDLMVHIPAAIVPVVGLATKPVASTIATPAVITEVICMVTAAVLAVAASVEAVGLTVSRVKVAALDAAPSAKPTSVTLAVNTFTQSSPKELLAIATCHTPAVDVSATAGPTATSPR